jgi:hypothetical protein
VFFGLHAAQERLSQTPANLIGPPPPGGLHGSADPSNAPLSLDWPLLSDRPAFACPSLHRNFRSGLRLRKSAKEKPRK